jgi:hypothetical protein
MKFSDDFEMCMKDNIYGQASCREITLGRLRHFTMISYVGDLVSATHPIILDVSGPVRSRHLGGDAGQVWFKLAQ